MPLSSTDAACLAEWIKEIEVADLPLLADDCGLDIQFLHAALAGDFEPLLNDKSAVRELALSCSDNALMSAVLEEADAAVLWRQAADVFQRLAA